MFVAADEALLGTAREAMRRAMAWASIVEDERLAAADDAGAGGGREATRRKTSRERRREGRAHAWSQFFTR